jgi:hypothetical protein
MKKILVKPKLKNSSPKSKVKTLRTISTPPLIVYKTHIAKPYVYPGSDINRYGIVVEIDSEQKKEAEFLKILEGIATEEKVDTIGHSDDDRIYIKFQTKEKIKIFIDDPDEKEPLEIDLNSEIPYGSKVVIKFDLNLYYNVTARKKGFNFCPKEIFMQLDSKIQKLVEMKNVGARKNSRGRPKLKVDRDSDAELEQRDE